jgi:hypothetical protein
MIWISSIYQLQEESGIIRSEMQIKSEIIAEHWIKIITLKM